MTGISKGAGIIRPNMATMLGYVATDAPISRELVQQLLSEMVNVSFNRITIDGDTSTNDSCIFAATGQAGGVEITSTLRCTLCRSARCTHAYDETLAQLIVRDG